MEAEGWAKKAITSAWKLMGEKRILVSLPRCKSFSSAKMNRISLS